MNFEIVKRKLSESEVKLLVSAVKKTPNITGHTQKEWLGFGEVLVGEVNRKLAGVSCIIDLGHNWVEIGALFVFDKYRGIGLGKALVKKAFAISEENESNIYMVSRNPIVIEMMRREKMFLTQNLFKLPLVIQRHNLKLIFNLYRIFEFFRKMVKFKHETGLTYGLKPFPDGD